MADQQKKESLPYHKAVIAALPFSVSQGLLELPKGTADQVVEQMLRGELTGKNIGKGFWSALKETGSSRAIGRFGVGALTAPIFLSGIKDLKSDDRRQKAIGLGKVMGSGFVAAAGKGAIEGLGREGWKWGPKTTEQMKALFTSRGLMGLAGAGAVAYSAARSMKEDEEGRHGFLRRAVLPAVAGIGAGAAKGFVDELEVLRRAGTPLKPTFQSVRTFLKTYGPRMGGRAAAGLIGAVGISELARWMMGKKQETKTSGLEKVAQVGRITEAMRNAVAGAGANMSATVGNALKRPTVFQSAPTTKRLAQIARWKNGPSPLVR